MYKVATNNAIPTANENTPKKNPNPPGPQNVFFWKSKLIIIYCMNLDISLILSHVQILG